MIFTATLAAGCAANRAPLPPPPPPPFAVDDRGNLPAPDQDQALIRAYEAKAGFKYTDEQNRLSLLSMFARRAERAGLPGYSMAWSEHGQTYVNLKPPIDSAATLKLAAPELRPRLQIRAVRFSAAEIQPAIERLSTATAPLKASSTISYNPKTDRFEIGIEKNRISEAQAVIPIDLAPYTDVFEGGAILVSAPLKRAERT